MTKEEFIALHEEEEKRHEGKMRAIDKAYAITNSPVKVGDIIEDHKCKMRVEKLCFVRCGYDYKRTTSCCAYKGVKLKKDGTPLKKQDNEAVYQYNIKSINGIPYDYSK